MNKQYRVKKSNEIEDIIKTGKSVGNKYFVIYKKENCETGHFRYAISVGKKVGNAVLRNKTKRQVRMIIQTLSNPLDQMDVFIVVKPSVLQITFEQMMSQINYLLKKLNSNK